MRLPDVKVPGPGPFPADLPGGLDERRPHPPDQAAQS